jgi:hypothetical protein
MRSWIRDSASTRPSPASPMPLFTTWRPRRNGPRHDFFGASRAPGHQATAPLAGPGGDVAGNCARSIHTGLSVPRPRFRPVSAWISDNEHT